MWVGLLLVVGVGLLAAAGFWLAPRTELTKADAIVAVSGGDTVSRAKEAIKLYQEGWAPVIIFSGAAKDPNSPSNAEAMRRIALAEGVPPDVILMDENSLTTKQNANEVALLLDVLNLKSIILVTSPYHQRRAYLEFRDRLDPGINILNHPAIDQTWGRRNWWLTPKGWYLTLTETPKTLFTQFIQ